MEEFFSELEQAYADYMKDIEDCEKKSRPTDGLLGFGRSMKDDLCHDRFDERVGKLVLSLAESHPSPEEAQRAAEMLLFRDRRPWPLPAQWMLRAAERHCIPLVPFLSPEGAYALYRDYSALYRPWDRLPAQKELLKALKAAAGIAPEGRHRRT